MDARKRRRSRENLEILPRRKVDYHGRVIEEFDIDAALARKPKLIVVDELAHTNAPDSRHPKRWQDIEELLDAGVDVWTALNIQHLESLADVVARITGVRVRETVPDRVLSEACDVVLVDITPDELLQRLREGKVYIPQTAKLASQNFFTPGNLTALRELALRRTAERVDDQMVDYLRQNAIEGPWATTERLLVCVGADFSSDSVVRAGARLATALNAEWTAVFVERPGQEETDVARVKRVDDAMRLAERLGAATERLSASDLAGELLRFARRENFTQIVLGRSRVGFFASLLGPVLDPGVGAPFARYRRAYRDRPERAAAGEARSSAAFAVIAGARGRRGGAFRRRRRRRRPVARALAALAKSVDDFSRRGDLLRLALWLVVGDRGGRALLFRLRLFFRRAAL